MNVISRGIADHVEPPTAAMAVNPAFMMNAFWILAKEKVIAPLFFIQLIGVFRSYNMRFTLSGEFSLVAITAPWTLDQEHQ